MFKEHDINGEQGLVYLLKDSEVLQSFHLAMLTTNPHLGAIPLQCTYLEGKEAIYYKTGHLISVERYLSENRLIQLSWIMKGLAETVKQLMGYQLFPENMCLDSQHVFIDLANRKVYLIYVPIKAHIYEAKNKMTSLLRQWLDTYINQMGNNHQHHMDYNPMMLKLILSLQQETINFSALLELMCQLGIDNGEKALAPQQARISNQNEEHKTPINISEQLSLRTDLNTSINIKETLKKKELKKNNLLKNHKPNGIFEKLTTSPKVFLVLIPAVFGLLGLSLAPLAIESKFGGALVLCAGSVWCVQKFKLLQVIKAEPAKGVPIPKEQKLTIQEPITTSSQEILHEKIFQYEEVPKTASSNITNTLTGEYLPFNELGKSEETLWINPNNKCGVLMLRSELGSKFVTLNKEVTTLGRNPSLCDVLIDEAGVGRVHAEIHMNDDKYYIKDAQSLNGSFVNGKKIPSNQYYELKTGDQIKIGSKEVIFT